MRPIGKYQCNYINKDTTPSGIARMGDRREDTLLSPVVLTIYLGKCFKKRYRDYRQLKW